MPLPSLARFLDPRPAHLAADKPIRDAVNIPLSELPERMHELGPRHRDVVIAGPEPYAVEAAVFLRECGRTAAVFEEWEFGDSGSGRLWEPNVFLQEVLGDLQAGSALDLACGTGRDAVALAGHGWQVTAVDHLEDALDRGRGLARRYLTEEADRIRWTCADLEGDES